MQAVASGSFSSDTGTALNLLVHWTAYSDGVSTVLDVSASVSSYTLAAGTIYNGVTLTAGGESYTFDSPAIDYRGEEQTIIPLGSHSFTLPEGSAGSISVGAVWNYRGTYSEQEFESITASGEASLG